jgi:epoxyqueuosine reductase
VEASGFHARLVPLRRLDDLREKFARMHASGELDEAFFQTWLAGFNFNPPADFPQARSILVIAGPAHLTLTTFTTPAKTVPVIVPPPYFIEESSDRRAEEIVEAALGDVPHRIARGIPLKSLATHSGLAHYGRNNITYVDGLGSYIRLTGFFTALPCTDENDPWQEPEAMERCATCQICLRCCPTRAISADRFLLHAERCLVYLNEKPSEIPFPEWVNPRWHHSLVGCLACERKCPENKDKETILDGPIFDLEETRHLMRGTPREQLPPALEQKLAEWDMYGYFDTFARNLTALLER